MALRQTAEQWGAVTKAFHWGMAVLILATMAIGVYDGQILHFEDISHRALWAWWMYQHKAMGMIALAVVPLRFAWTRLQPRPALPAMSPVHRMIARLSVYALYAAMVAAPFCGLMTAFYYGSANKFFGLFEFGSPLPKNLALSSLYQTAHQVSAYILLALLAAHVAAAAAHHWLLKDDLLTRMIPELESRSADRPAQAAESSV